MLVTCVPLYMYVHTLVNLSAFYVYLYPSSSVFPRTVSGTCAFTGVCPDLRERYAIADAMTLRSILSESSSSVMDPILRALTRLCGEQSRVGLKPYVKSLVEAMTCTQQNKLVKRSAGFTNHYVEGWHVLPRGVTLNINHHILFTYIFALRHQGLGKGR